MAIKFNCSCGKSMSVPDKLAGKKGKCPSCQKPIKVPIPKVAKTSSTAGSETAAVLDSLFDDAGLVKKSGPVCPSCAAPIKQSGAIVCVSCGMNFETGERAKGFDAKAAGGPEFTNMHLQEASDNMKRDLMMDSRRDKSSMPWWVIMSYLIGAITLCGAGVVIVDGIVGTPADPNSFLGKVQALPVFCTLGATALITGAAITIFAHLSICAFAFGRSMGQGFACFLLPLLYSIIYGIMNWTDNKAPVKAIISALIFISLGVFLIIQGGGFGKIQAVF